MDTEIKRNLIEKIRELRLTEYLNGLANGIQHHEEAARNNLKANKLFDEIFELIYTENYKQTNG